MTVAPVGIGHAMAEVGMMHHREERDLSRQASGGRPSAGRPSRGRRRRLYRSRLDDPSAHDIGAHVGSLQQRFQIVRDRRHQRSEGQLRGVVALIAEESACQGLGDGARPVDVVAGRDELESMSVA